MERECTLGLPAPRLRGDKASRATTRLNQASETERQIEVGIKDGTKADRFYETSVGRIHFDPPFRMEWRIGVHPFQAGQRDSSFGNVETCFRIDGGREAS